MDDSPGNSDTRNPEANPDNPGHHKKRRANMHEGIAVWADCCSCEAEPYWIEIGKEMGIEPGDDYEDSAQ